MKIGIIGAGHIGGTLTRRLTSLGHQVSVANSRGGDTLSALARDTGAKPVSVTEAARSGEIVIVTIPLKNIPKLPRNLFSGLDGVTVIDTCNYYPQQRDGLIQPIEDGMPESRWVEEQIGHPAIKVFNNIYAQHLLELGRPAGSPDRIALPVSGDDPSAKETVMRLVDQLGFDPVDAGTIDESWRQQPGTPVYAQDFNADGVRRSLSQARPERRTEWRATPASPGNYAKPA